MYYTVFTVSANLRDGRTVFSREKLLGKRNPWRREIKAAVESSTGGEVAHIRISEREFVEL